VGVEFFHADGRTDGQRSMTKMIVAPCSLANAPKNQDRDDVQLQ